MGAHTLELTIFLPKTSYQYIFGVPKTHYLAFKTDFDKNHYKDIRDKFKHHFIHIHTYAYTYACI